MGNPLCVCVCVYVSIYTLRTPRHLLLTVSFPIDSGIIFEEYFAWGIEEYRQIYFVFNVGLSEHLSACVSRNNYTNVPLIRPNTNYSDIRIF